MSDDSEFVRPQPSYVNPESFYGSPQSPRSPGLATGSSDSCILCQSEFGVTRRRYRCRMCGEEICSSCSSSRIRIVVGEDKVRACDECANEWRVAHADEMEESVDIRRQMNESLKTLLKAKYEEIEFLKKEMVSIVDSQPYMQEAPSLTAPFRFSSSMGLDRIDFSELVQFMESKIQFLRTRAEELQKAAESEEVQQSERRRNFGFLQERTEKAEVDASRVTELVDQRDRLRDIFREQAVKLRSLKDRVDILEDRDLRVSVAVSDVEAIEFIGDTLIEKYCPCIP